MATPRPITFLSDYGYEDEFAGVCRAVISQIAPGAPLIDLTHGIGRQDVRQGAMALANALPSCPPGVHLAVVDPGVGSERRAVAVASAEGRFLVGPDNGLLSRAFDRLGGGLDAVELSRSAFRLDGRRSRLTAVFDQCEPPLGDGWTRRAGLPGLASPTCPPRPRTRRGKALTRSATSLSISTCPCLAADQTGAAPEFAPGRRFEGVWALPSLTPSLPTSSSSKIPPAPRPGRRRGGAPG